MWKLFKACCENTTAHGFPNVVTKNRVVIKFSWVIFVLAAAVVYGYHGSTLIIQFLNKPTKVSETPYAIEFITPDIIFCRRMPLSLNYIEWDEYQEIENYLYIKKVLEDINDVMDTDQFYNIEMLWQTVSVETMFKTIGNDLQQNLVELFARSFDGSFVELSYYEIIPHWKYLACLRFQTYKINFTGQASVLRASYFTDAHIYEEQGVKIYGYPLADLPMSHIEYEDIKSDIGYQIYIVPEGEYPHIDATSLSASVGEMTEISIKMRLKDMLSTDHAPCSDYYETVTYVNIIDSESPITFNATAWDCAYKMYHERAMQECGCTTHIYPVTVERQKKGVKYCLNLNEVNITDYNELNRRDSCTTKLKQELRNFYKLCQNRSLCKTPVYGAESKSFELSIQSILDNDLSATGSTGPGITKYEEMRMSADISPLNLKKLAQNNLEIIVHPGEMFSPQMKEEYTYLVKNLASDLGGLLGFYMGISFVTVCELIGLFLEGIFICHKKNKTDSNDLPEVSIGDSKSGISLKHIHTENTYI